LKDINIFNSKKVCCNYALRAQVGPETSKEDVRDLTGEDFGINTFRMNMSGEQRFSSDGDMIEMLECVRAVGGLAQVHAESGDIIEMAERSMIQRGITGPEGFAQSHTEASDEEATMRATTLANQVR
jgi:dihydropyrimidinase